MVARGGGDGGGGENVACVAHVVVVMSKRLKSVFARSQKAAKNGVEQRRATNANWERR